MGIPIAPVVDLAMCVLFHICTVNNGYANQRMKLCADNTAVLPEQKCPDKPKEQQQAPAAVVPQSQPQSQPQPQQEEDTPHE